MRKIWQLVILLYCYIALLLLWPSKVLASDEFETTYDVRYQVNQEGVVIVDQRVFLKNKLANVYATQYSLSLEGGGVQNIRAWDKEGDLAVKTFSQGDQTRIQLDFNYQAVGLGKTFDFQLTYEVLDLAQRNGQVWEISIPKLSPETKIDHYSLKLLVPFAFGEPAYIVPQPISRDREGNNYLFSFSKEQVSTSGVKAVFGEYQIFDFVLNYNLENPNSVWGETEIALPPDTAFQRVFYERIDPAPLNVKVDNDGNWLAKYRIPPEEKLTVAAKGKAKVFAEPQEKFFVPDEENLKKNLLAQKFWEINEPLIKNKARDLKTAREIYRFVVDTLDYDYSRVAKGIERLGALVALREPSRAICTEFTDLFVALARANGIPAREVNGYAYTTNKKFRPLGLIADILHAWPEYWDDKRKIWIPIDPTWEKTTAGIDHFYKTDLNHFTFVFHGEKSEYPYPAGSYKTESSFGRDVQVTFGQYGIEGLPKHEVQFDFPDSLLSQSGNQGKIILKNTGSQALYDLKIGLEGKGLIVEPIEPWAETISLLPPYSHQEISVRIKPTKWFGQKEGLVSFRVNGEEYRFWIKISSLLGQLLLPLGIVFVLALGVAFMLKIRCQYQR